MSQEWTNKNEEVVAVSFWGGNTAGRVVQVQKGFWEEWSNSEVFFDCAGQRFTKAEVVRNDTVRRWTVWDSRKVRAAWQRAAQKFSDHVSVAFACAAEAQRWER